MNPHIGTLNVDTGSVLKGVTLDVRVRTRAATRFRLWLGKALLILGAKALGAHINLDVKTSPPPFPAGKRA